MKKKKYKIVASQTIYATYEIEIEADNEKQAEESEQKEKPSQRGELLCSNSEVTA